MEQNELIEAFGKVAVASVADAVMSAARSGDSDDRAVFVIARR